MDIYLFRADWELCKKARLFGMVESAIPSIRYNDSVASYLIFRSCTRNISASSAPQGGMGWDSIACLIRGIHISCPLRFMCNWSFLYSSSRTSPCESYIASTTSTYINASWLSAKFCTRKFSESPLAQILSLLGACGTETKYTCVLGYTAHSRCRNVLKSSNTVWAGLRKRSFVPQKKSTRAGAYGISRLSI